MPDDALSLTYVRRLVQAHGWAAVYETVMEAATTEPDDGAEGRYWERVSAWTEHVAGYSEPDPAWNLDY